MAKSSSPVKRTRMKRLGLLLVFVAACKGPAQEAHKEPPPAPNPVTAVALPPPVGEEVAVDYRTQSDGQALDEEPGDQAKLNLRRSAAAKQWFTSAMAGVLIDHIVYRENKLAAVPILKDRILDRENAFWLYQHFTYREDKAKVQEILEH